ncbi:MAG: bifunctional tRNA (5-methylaminomethyl-2-thiouridine)(34)-methyltransferase MnmD/FAD-dependent 5-carboxymethylaminomethyl-2-thiouridine(34) oxidoreductase MnmC [Kangiellaceae bacterium]|nr:bifunctional tRNA (5-methylaminomethyl-2-thiouridine)(34)-methyltransferase MnmD/FAD-dependent 5-carboxymethylaminomethyl-2-thiouridine(34) oxidoreductase MnmC [Kangiellaceae bacterium]MCW8998641.1 bifunctional tRNA (5-methylaminomethyl-2-thiouridine)(34)-methyltransferase MnmD/FAD-dependent 5-carboxymethylaminomethyl-2-thiouridine(34) oxidoreductase MnmC [Kangiellaceae bacterium]
MSSSHLLKFEKVKPAEIVWREDIPFSKEFDDIYFNPQDGLAESEYVFLEGNDLPNDWVNSRQTNFCLAELGFGSGLNFLMTAARWQQSRTENKNLEHLNYISIEKRPFFASDLKRSHQHWPQFKTISEALLGRYPSLTYGRHQLVFSELKLTLTLMIMPAEDALADLELESRQQQNKIKIDHWFLDGFAPAKNQSMWGLSLAKKLARLSNTGSKLATFSVASSVRRPLQQAGFSLTKKKGFGRKREMLTAKYTEENTLLDTSESPRTPKAIRYLNLKYDKPWFNLSPSQRDNNSNRIAIIGAGIAGCALSFQLAKYGYQIDLYDENKSIASSASGAAAGIFHPQLTADMNYNSQLNWLAYLYLLRFLQELTSKEKSEIILSQGLVRLLPEKKSRQQLHQLTTKLLLSEWIKDEDFYHSSRGVFFPHSAAIDIPALCHLLLSKISVSQLNLEFEQKIQQLEQVSDGWKIISEKVERKYPHVILCGGANSLLTKRWLNCETNTTRGQTCFFKNKDLSQNLPKALVEQTYVVPKGVDTIHLGTTFENFTDDNLNQQSQTNMLLKANTLLTELKLPTISRQQVETLPLKGTLGYRLHSMDRLPLVGPVSDVAKLEKDFANIGQRRINMADLSYYNLPGLWLNTAYGSHGLLYSLIVSSHLASLIANDISPISSELANSISPIRMHFRKSN